LRAGFGETDITPKLGDRPVYLAGFGQNRKATGVHDPLGARAVVLRHGDRKLALVALDLVGFFRPNVVHVRERLPGFAYVLVCSTHQHEGPDTLGLWGPNPFTSGIDPAYMQYVEEQAAQAVRAADAAARPVTARLGTARAPELLRDGREPYVKHDELTALEFREAGGDRPAGLLVQWNCHPETLGSKNTEVSADFVGATVQYLRDRHHCPVVFVNGTVGGLMTSLGVEVKDGRGKLLADGTWEKTERYGRLVGELADRALASARPVALTPLEARGREVFLPLTNKAYLLGRRLGVLDREGFLWTGDPYHAEPAAPKEVTRPLCIRTEVGWLRLGDVEVAAIPGEIYPELVLDQVQDPPDPGADFPDAPVEPAIYKQMKAPHRMIVGLANDEVGYIIPKRQWDEKPPYCYGRTKPQYGEGNSVGPDAAPVLCRAFRELAAGPDAAERHLLYVAEPGIRDYVELGGAGILVFDRDRDFAFVKRVETPAGRKEHPENVKGVCACAATRRLYFTTLTRLYCLDLVTEKTLWEKALPGGCDRMSIAPDGQRLYVPSLEGPHWNVVDAATGDVVAKIETGSGAHNTVCGLDGKHVYLAGLKSPLLRVLDTGTQKVVGTVGPFAAPIRPFTVNGAQTLCFVNVNELLGFEVGDLRTGKKLCRVEVEGFRKGPTKRHGCPSHGVGLTPDEKEVWVCDAFNSRVHVFDATTMPPKQVASIALRDQPGWVTFSLDGRHAYPSTGEVIDTRTRKIVAALHDEKGRQVHSEKLLEIVFRGDVPVRAGDQFGLGRVTAAAETAAPK
jgi:DNA-binding beta-propeller fold protein YncE